ncbi:hypothetical protein P7C70_g2686, partial [Phenoliferia sp. Uapishka_3]
MSTLPSMRPSTTHLQSTHPHPLSQANTQHSQSQRFSQSPNRSVQHPLPPPLNRPSHSPGPVPSLDPSNPDPRSAGSSISSDGGPITPGDYPRLIKDHLDHASSSKRRASTTSLNHTPRVLLQPIPPFVHRKSMPARTDSRANTPTATSAATFPFPSVLTRVSPSPNEDNMDVNQEHEESELRGSGLGISVKSTGEYSTKKRRVDEDYDCDSAATSPKQIKREHSLSPRTLPDDPASLSHAQSLDTLASAASAISASAQLHSNLPHPPPSPIVLPLQPPSDPEKASQLANALNLRTQQLREIERRRAANSPAGASGSSMGGLSGALAKLSQVTQQAGASAPPSLAGAGADVAEGSGLASRRGNVAREKTKNLTISTASAANTVEAALRSAPAPLSRMAPGVTPSVLAGPSSRMGGLATARPDFAGERRGSLGEPSRGRPSAASKADRSRGPATASSQPPPPPPSSRREPYPSVTQPAQNQRGSGPSEGSSYHPREREQHQLHRQSLPLGQGPPPPPHSVSHPHYPATAHSFHPNPQQQQQMQPPPRSARPYTNNSPPTNSHHSPPSAHHLSHSQQSVQHAQHSPLPPHTAQPQLQQQQQQQQQGNPQNSSKAAFLSLFSTFYDSLSDSRVLAQTLEDQIRRSSSLLHTLHESGKVFEDMLDKRVKEVVEDMSRDLLLNEGRIVRLEKLVGVGAAKGETREGGMGDRLGRLESMVEKLLAERERGGGSRRGSDEMSQ